MVMLPPATWVRLALWMVLGLLLYLFLGRTQQPVNALACSNE
jgi:hypothetical protein